MMMMMMVMWSPLTRRQRSDRFLDELCSHFRWRSLHPKHTNLTNPCIILLLLSRVRPSHTRSKSFHEDRSAEAKTIQNKQSQHLVCLFVAGGLSRKYTVSRALQLRLPNHRLLSCSDCYSVTFQSRHDGGLRSVPSRCIVRSHWTVWPPERAGLPEHPFITGVQAVVIDVILTGVSSYIALVMLTKMSSLALSPPFSVASTISCTSTSFYPSNASKCVIFHLELKSG